MRPGLNLRPEDLPYRPCVGVMLMNEEGLVFVGRRIDQTVEGWQMPQGGIDLGEDPKTAALRELKEEIGTNKAELLREMDEWLTYDLPPHLVGVALKGRLPRPGRNGWRCGSPAGTRISTSTPTSLNSLNGSGSRWKPFHA